MIFFFFIIIKSWRPLINKISSLLDRNDYYGGKWSSFTLQGIEQWIGGLDKGAVKDNKAGKEWRFLISMTNIFFSPLPHPLSFFFLFFFSSSLFFFFLSWLEVKMPWLYISREWYEWERIFSQYFDYIVVRNT